MNDLNTKNLVGSCSGIYNFILFKGSIKILFIPNEPSIFKYIAKV